MPEPRTERPRFCPQCGHAVVVPDAVYCKECGAPLPNTVWLDRTRGWNPMTAGVLSVVPGLGHWYKGERLRGFAWFFAVLFFYYYATEGLGLLMHMICAGNAAFSGASRAAALTARGGSRRAAPMTAAVRSSR
jgi:hypothetical protein